MAASADARLRMWLTHNSSATTAGDKSIVVLTSDPVELRELIDLLKEGHDWFGESLLDALYRAEVPICKECQEIVEGDERVKKGMNCEVCA
jgi:hypothetical protein